jgi:phenylalanyl-tRNA synthetase beta subunit
MKFSKNWLQDYIVETLPSDAVIAETLNKKAFEVEETTVITRTQTAQTSADHADSTYGDAIFDIKVLPNRAHDALGHHGMAYELCSSLALTFNKEKEVEDDQSFFDKSVPTVSVAIEDATLCTRFMSMRIDNVVVGESPVWLKERLESIGQRSINNIVDVTNYVQFSLNKPMHAYDARSIKGTLAARLARKGEELITLDDKHLMLNENTLVIADDEKVLGLAGIKGGKYSGIQQDTTSIILESANFNPVLIRKTSEAYGIKTDASKRFENGIANNLVIEGLHMTANLIHALCGSAHKGVATDIYPKKDTPYYVGISKKELNDILGTSYDDVLIKKTLAQLSFPYEVIIPSEYIQATYPTLLGAGYKNPSSMREDAPHMFSCSSLISYLYKGVWMPSLSIDKFVFSKKVTKNDLQFGDLIFANSGEGKIRFESVEFLRGTKVPEGIDHVGMYCGDGKVVHATKVKGMVVEETIEEFGALRTITGYGRIVDDLKEERYVVRVPSVRLDIRIKEDLAEEIGRIIGYEKLVPTLPTLAHTGLLHKRAVYENKVREILIARGFSEVITYTFGDVGEVTLMKGIADDKEKLRATLGKGVLDALTRNLYNAPLLGQKTIKIFEFGKVFTGGKEVKHLALALDDGGKKTSFTEEVEMILMEIKRTLVVDAIECDTVSTKPYVIEIDFDTLIASLPEATTYETPSLATLPPITYKTVSPYPFISRDIAMWVPDSVTWEDISTLCAQVGNPLVARIDLFDTFTKEKDGIKQTSYAFRLVFQSYEKTLTDDEVNAHMEAYYSLFKGKGYEIR